MEITLDTWRYKGGNNLNKTIIQRLNAIEHELERRCEAWQAPDALSAGLREVPRDELMELAKKLDLMQ